MGSAFKIIRRGRIAAAALVIVAGVGAGTADAAAILTADAAFFYEQAATRFNVPLKEDGFEGLPEGFTDPIDRGDFTVTPEKIVDVTKLFIHNDPASATEGVNVLISPSFLGELIFEFATPTRAFGFDAINMTFPVRATAFVVEIDGQRGFMPIFAIDGDPATDFWGFLSDTPFQRIVVNNFITTEEFSDFDLTATSWRIDRIRYEDPNGSATPVPEPASMLLLGTGLCGAAWQGRRTRKRGN